MYRVTVLSFHGVKDADPIPLHTRGRKGGCAIKLPKDDGSAGRLFIFQL